MIYLIISCLKFLVGKSKQSVPVVFGGGYAIGNFGLTTGLGNNAHRPHVEVSTNEAVLPVIALFNYAARTAEELSFDVGEWYYTITLYVINLVFNHDIQCCWPKKV